MGGATENETDEQRAFREELLSLIGPDNLLLEAFLSPFGGNGKIKISEHGWFSNAVSYDNSGPNDDPVIYIDLSVLQENGALWGLMKLHEMLSLAWVKDRGGAYKADQSNIGEGSTQAYYNAMYLGREGAGKFSEELAKQRQAAFKQAAAEAAQIMETVEEGAEITVSVVNNGADMVLMIEMLSDDEIPITHKIPIAIAGGLPFINASAGRKIGEGISWVWKKTGGRWFTKAPKGTQIILKDGFYEVAGMKITKQYYEKLWSGGRGAPFVVAREILENGTKVGPDAVKPGFYVYRLNDWKMIFNPKTGEIWHLQPKDF